MVAEFQAWMEDLLRAALPLLDLPLRAAVLHLYPGARPEGWTANVDFPVLGAPEDWPHDRNFPPLDTLEGRQARLRYLGYPVQDPPGISGASTIAALILYQVQQGLPSRGDWDDATLQSLDLDAFCRMSEHREDPSELL
jgi:hypothetical protein